MLRGEITLDEFYENYPREFKFAQETTLLSTLGEGESKDRDIHGAIEEALSGSSHWALVGGPPCQAYSNVGKSVRKGNAEYNPDNDQRHVLYREYLKVIAEFWPSVFVMENVPGVFSAKFKGKNVWPDILADLTDPISALGMEGRTVDFDGYRLYSGGKRPWNGYFWRYDTE